MKITIMKADITTLKVDAIVNAANSLGYLGGGVAGAIKRKGGKMIEDEAIEKAPTPVGMACATTAGNLPAGAVIHAPTMEEPACPSSKQNVSAATMAALMLARDLGYRRVAIPGMGTGVGGVSHHDAAHAIVHAIHAFDKSEFDEIILADINDEMIQAFKEAMQEER
ncbi:MAG: macro domain-containing protein [Pseudomonadota bacterium]